MAKHKVKEELSTEHKAKPWRKKIAARRNCNAWRRKREENVVITS